LFSPVTMAGLILLNITEPSMKYLVILLLFFVLPVSAANTTLAPNTKLASRHASDKAAAEQAEAARKAAEAADKAAADKMAAEKFAAEKLAAEMEEPYDIRVTPNVHIICPTKRVAKKLIPLAIMLSANMNPQRDLWFSYDATGLDIKNTRTGVEIQLPLSYGCGLFTDPRGSGY
jgi:hypothetical protein